MRPLIIALVATGVILMGWLLLRGEGGDTSGQATPSQAGAPTAPPTVPSTWWTNVLGVLTSPFAPAVKMGSLTFTFRSGATTVVPSTGPATVDSSTGKATITLPSAKGSGPRVARFKMDDGANAVVQINYTGSPPDKAMTLNLVPPGLSAPTPCDPSNCGSSYPKGSLAVPEDGGTVTLRLLPSTPQPNAPQPSQPQPPGATVTLVP